MGGLARSQVMGDLVLARQRGLLHKGCQAVLTNVVDEDVAENVDKDVDEVVAKDVDKNVDAVVAEGGSSYPHQTCCWLTGPAQTALLSS